MSDSGEKKDQNKDDNRGEKIKPILSPFSPFPFGSPVQQGKVQSPFGQTKPTKPNQVQTPFSGSPGQKLLLNSLNRKNDVTTPGPRLLTATTRSSVPSSAPWKVTRWVERRSSILRHLSLYHSQRSQH